MSGAPTLLPYRGHWPSLASGVWVAPNATVIGQVDLGEDTNVWFQAVIRGDVMPITIGARTNVQDSVVVHASTGVSPTRIGSDVTIGHQATIHGATLERGCLIGIRAVILDGAVVGEGALVGAGAVVSPRTVIPPGVLALGAPARVKRELTDAERAMLQQSAAHYVHLAAAYPA